MESKIPNSLKARVLKAAGFLLSGQVLGQIIRLGGNLITTRLLVPELFGVMAIVMTITAGLNLMSDLGVKQSIIRSKQGETLSFLQTAWVFQIARGILLGIICFLLALCLLYAQSVYEFSPDNVYGNENLPTAIAIIAFSTAVLGFVSIETFVAERNLYFGKISLYELLNQASTVLAIIIWASFSPTIWALAFGTLIGSVVTVILSHVIFPSKANSFGWDKSAASELFNFGKWLLLSSSLGFISLRGDRIIFSFFMTTGDLGRYAIALALIDAVKHLFAKLGDIWFPALSETSRDNPEKFARYYYIIRKYQDAIIFLSAGFLIATGDLIISILYDERYVNSGWMLQILAISLIFMAHNIKGSILLIDGKSNIFSLMVFIRALATLICIPTFYHLFGITGALIMAACVEFTGTFVAFHYFHKKKILKIHKELLFVPLILVGYVVGIMGKSLLNTLIQ